MYYNNGYMPQNSYYQPMNNGAMPDNLSMLRQQSGQYQQQFPQYQQNVQPNPQMPAQQQQINNSGMVWVSGYDEASNFPVAPNTAVALWDSNNAVVYLRKADSSGKPTTETYDLVRRDSAVQQTVQSPVASTVDYITRDEFNALEAKINGFINEKTPSKSKKTATEE